MYQNILILRAKLYTRKLLTHLSLKTDHFIARFSTGAKWCFYHIQSVVGHFGATIKYVEGTKVVVYVRSKVYFYFASSFCTRPIFRNDYKNISVCLNMCNHCSV